jgi:hypothetical protein
MTQTNSQHSVTIDQRELIATTLMISTASRRELENMCSQQGVPFASQPSATLRQALKQRMLVK